MNILVLDEFDNHYKIRTNLELIKDANVTNCESLEDLRLKLYEADPDIVIYNKDILNINIHDIIATLLDAEYTTIPVIVLSKLPQHIIFIEHDQLFGPYNFDMDKYSLTSTINSVLKYKKYYQQFKELKEENERLKDGIILKHEEDSFNDISLFKVKLIQEVKRARRFNDPLSLLIIKFDNYNDLCEEYNISIVKSFMKNLTQSIKEAIRDTDIPMSYDKNKILILMPSTDDKGLENAITRLRSNILRTQYVQDNIVLTTTPKFGAAAMSDKISTFSEMVKKALTLID